MLDGQALPIEDYALIGDQLTAALVGKNGSIDWLCLPRFDSSACFAALLGTRDNGYWQIAPSGEYRVSRRYQDGTMVLETTFTTATGSFALIDFMSIGQPNTHLVRIVRGLSGTVAVTMHLAFRFDYGVSIPWVTKLPDYGGIVAIAGPDLVALHTTTALHGRNMTTVADFTIHAGEERYFCLTHAASHLPVPPAPDPKQALADTCAYWESFIGRCRFRAPPGRERWGQAVGRSLLTLKALTYRTTGGIVAAPTTSLPEQLGGGRNWDYRYCWLRDATLVLFALMDAGYTDEASAWRDWLQRSIAGSAAQIQIMYGLAGERRLDEWEVPWLAGYQGASPVRIGNAASGQVQLDVFGEVLECLHQARRHGLKPAMHGWGLQTGVVEHLISIWDQPDEGLWEVRGGRRNFTFSKVMAWVAVDRMIKDAKRFHMSGDLDKWQRVRQEIFDNILTNGFDHGRNTFTQSYGAKELDASLLLLPVVGFLPPDDPRIIGTIKAIEQDLLEDGFVRRYRPSSGVDGLQGGEGAFLACTFWLAQAYHLSGRQKEAESTFERLLDLQNDVGLLAEEYDPRAKRQVGNFPQAFSHVALVSAALNLSGGRVTARNHHDRDAPRS